MSNKLFGISVLFIRDHLSTSNKHTRTPKTPQDRTDHLRINSFPVLHLIMQSTSDFHRLIEPYSVQELWHWVSICAPIIVGIDLCVIAAIVYLQYSNPQAQRQYEPTDRSITQQISDRTPGEEEGSRVTRLCKCLIDSTVQKTLVNMDPLVAAAFHNLVCSPLCRLPEEILLSIMAVLDPLSIQCLRRTSRLFLRLFSSPEFQFGHVTSYVGLRFDPWPVPKREYWRPFGRLKALLDKDKEAQCDDCHRKRQETTWMKDYTYLKEEYLHCSGCRVDHPAGLFSPTQRLASTESRVCRGHDGVLRVCKHRAVSWAEISSIAVGLRKLDVRLMQGRRVHVPVIRCEDSTHIPRNHGSNSPQVFYGDEFPEVSVVWDIEGSVAIHMRWTGHLNLPGVDTIANHYNEPPMPMAADTMRQLLQKFRKTSPAEFIAPELQPGRLMEMQCFDPNRCSCLHYKGSELLPAHKWQVTPSGDAQQALCRVSPGSQQICLHARQWDRGQPQLDTRRQPVGGPFTQVFMSGHGNSEASVVRIRVDPCLGCVDSSSQCLRIKYERVIRIANASATQSDDVFTHLAAWSKRKSAAADKPLPMAEAWCQALDPASYNLSNDDKAFHILWCRHPGCANYHRKARHSFIPFRRANRECGPKCPGH